MGPLQLPFLMLYPISFHNPQVYVLTTEGQPWRVASSPAASVSRNPIVSGKLKITSGICDGRSAEWTTEREGRHKGRVQTNLY